MNKPTAKKISAAEKTARQVRIAIAQINTIVGDFKYNVQLIEASLRKARKAQADIILFPELTLTGYPPEDLLLKKDFVRENQERLKSLVAKTAGLIVLIGYAERFKNELYNSMAVISDGHLLGSCRKMILPNYGVFDEHRYFKEGQTPTCFVRDGVVYALTICEDLWTPDGPAKILCGEGRADVILNLSASPFFRGKGKQRREMFRQRAKQCRAAVVWANLVGGQDELLFDGQSLVISSDGSVIAHGNSFQEEMIFADVIIAKPKALAAKTLPRSRGKINAIKIPAPRGGWKKRDNLLPQHDYSRKPDIQMIYEGLVMGTRDYLGKNAFKKAVIGLSGGIDSALTAAIAADALGPQNAVGVLMPSPYSSKGSVADSLKLAENLGIQTLSLPIEKIMRAYTETLAETFRGTAAGIAEENLQARIRGALLMALSNKRGWLVLTTGNKSEIGVGYCTLYGDMAGGFSVIKDVPKTLVYELARYVNERNGKDIIPIETLEKEPSAELRPNQKDSDSLPPYSKLDAILKSYVEEDKGMDELRRLGFSKKEIVKVTQMVDQNEYKRRQGAPGIKITPKAFGKDRRLPITNHYKCRVR